MFLNLFVFSEAKIVYVPPARRPEKSRGGPGGAARPPEKKKLLERPLRSQLVGWLVGCPVVSPGPPVS